VEVLTRIVTPATGTELRQIDVFPKYVVWVFAQTPVTLTYYGRQEANNTAHDCHRITISCHVTGELLQTFRRNLMPSFSRDKNSNPDRRKRFSLLQNVQISSGPNPASYSNSAELKNEWSHTSIPPAFLYNVDRNISTFTSSLDRATVAIPYTISETSCIYIEECQQSFIVQISVMFLVILWFQGHMPHKSFPRVHHVVVDPRRREMLCYKQDFEENEHPQICDKNIAKTSERLDCKHT
jgi:hypothetical protein